MFLDAQGRKLMKHRGARTTKGFEKSLEESQDFLAQIRKVENGDKRNAGKVFIRQLELHWFSFDEATKRYAELGKVSSKDKKLIEPMLIDTEIRVLAKEAGKDDEKQLAAGAHFAQMWKDKRLPSAASEEYAFWSFIMSFAESKGDKRLFKKALGKYEKSDAVKQSSRMRAAIHDMKDRLKAL